MDSERSRRGSGGGGDGRPRAVFMAFGTKGDVFPIAALASAFANEEEQYHVVFITHSAHEDLGVHLEAKHVSFYPIPTPPVLSAHQPNSNSGAVSFCEHKKTIQKEHRQACLSAMDRIFGYDATLEGDFIVINFFALEGWSLAELFHVRCVVAAPYVVPYSAPTSFEEQFQSELPLLYKFLREASSNKVSWKDIVHWMWPLFTEEWGSWRHECLNLSTFPFTDPVTGLPMWNCGESSPLLLYGFSEEIVECPGYWPSSVHPCGFWFLPMEWQFSCARCRELSMRTSENLPARAYLCPSHANLQYFLEQSDTRPVIFIGLSSVGSMGFIHNPGAFLLILKAVSESTRYKFILFTSGYKPLDSIIRFYSETTSSDMLHCGKEDETLLFNKRLFCFTGSIPYSWIFPRCSVALHHAGSGTTAAALHAGIPQLPCPFILDQFYWAERMCWLGVAPETLQKNVLIPDDNDASTIALAAGILSKAIESALSPRLKAKAMEVANRISTEDGIRKALKVLKQEVVPPPPPPPPWKLRK